MIGTGTTAGMKAFRSIYGLHRLSSGHLVAFFNAGGYLSYASSPDGLTWSAVVRVPNNIAMAALMALDVRNDILTTFTGEPSQTVRHYTWNGSWVAGPFVSAGVVGAYGLDAQWQPASGVIGGGYYAVNYRGVASGTWLQTQVSDGVSGGLIGPQNLLPNSGISELTPLNLGGLTTLAASVTGVVWNLASLYFVLGWQASTASLVLVSKMAAYGNAPLVEIVTAMPTEQQWDAVVELDRTTLTIVYRLGTSLYACRRTGFNVYSAPVPIATDVSGPFFLVQDPASGDLVVVYQTGANGTQEINLVARRGTWLQPVRVVGGDGLNHQFPVGMHDASGLIVGVLYTDDTIVKYTSLPIGGTPQAPTPLAPIGTVTSLPPVFTSRYNNILIPDPPAGGELKVVRQSDGAVMWDSGETPTLAPDTVTYLAPSTVHGASTEVITITNAYGGATLSFDALYQWSRRDKDTLTGTYGPWSAATTFIAREGGTATILAINHDGVVSTSRQATLTANLKRIGATRTAPMAASLAHLRIASMAGVLLSRVIRTAPMSGALGQSLVRQTAISVRLISITTRTAPMSAELS